MKKKIKYLVLILIIGILIIPRAASADFLGIVNAIQASLGGIEEISRSVAKYIFLFFSIYIVSIASLYTSAHLLQFTTENTQWLSVYNNEMVRSGWHFTSGIANMLIVLILMVIALSFILKRETFEIKKTLPKLLMVALLINFSLVFVGALVDISNIIFNTILAGNQGLPFQVIDILGVGMWGILNSLMGWIVLLVVAFAIPFVSSFAQLGFVIGVVSVAFLPNILIWLFQIFSSFSTSILFLTYAFLFGARIFIIQILAIVSPLAFLCFILPQTEKYWDEWLNHLIQWLFLGISLFFFLVIGLRAASWIMPPGVSYPISAATIPGLSWFNIGGSFVYYFFLFVYLAVAGWMSKKAMPTVASVIIAQGKELGGFMWKGVKPLGRAFTRTTAQAVGEKMGPRMAGWGERQRLESKEKGAEAKTRLGRARWALRRRIATGAEIAGRGMEARTEEYRTGEIEGAKSKIKGKPEKRQFVELQKALATKNPREVIGIMEAMMEDKTLGKAEEAGIFETKEYQEYVAEAAKRGRKGLVLYDPERAASVVEPEKWKAAQSKKDEGERHIEKAKLATTPVKKAWLRVEGKKLIEEGEKLQRGILSDTLKGIKPSQVAQMSEKFLQSKTGKEAIVDTFTGSQMAEVARTFGRDVVEGIQKEIGKKEIGKKKLVELVKRNPNLALWLSGNVAQNLGFRLSGAAELGRVEVKREIQEARIRAEPNREKQKKKLETHYKGEEAMMFRDYHRKDTSSEKRALIKTILGERGKAIPLKAEVERRIREEEKEIDKIRGELEKHWETWKKAKDVYEKAGSPASSKPEHKIWKEARDQWKKIRSEADKAEKDQEKVIKIKLQDLL